MKEQQKNRRTILLLFSMTIIPFCIAWYMSSNLDWVGNGTNQGQLIRPVITTDISEFVGYDQFSKDNINELKGHWVLVNILPHKLCETTCLESIHKTKQLRLMMSKDISRVRRVALVLSDVKESVAKAWWEDDGRLLRVKPTDSLVQKLKKIRKAGIPEGMMLLMDPMGNVMMQYDPGFDPYKVKKDLGKLLRISQIG